MNRLFVILYGEIDTLNELIALILTNSKLLANDDQKAYHHYIHQRYDILVYSTYRRNLMNNHKELETLFI